MSTKFPELFAGVTERQEAKADIEDPKLPPLIAELLGAETVIIHVGPDRKPFTIHKELLMQSSDFFKAGFGSNFPEAKEGVMYMPEDTPGAFSLFVEWLYRGQLTLSNTKSRLYAAYELYFLATKLMLVELMDMAMDLIQDMSHMFEEVIDVGLLRTIYEKTPAGSQLRAFGVQWYNFMRFWKSNQKKLCKSSGIATYERAPAKVYAGETTGLLQEDFHFSSRELSRIWKTTRGDASSELFQDIIKDAQIGDPVHVENPAYCRKPRVPDYDGCAFHAHAKGINCRPKEFKNVGLKLINDMQASG